jgi:predicted PurR-regulated permease PerM
MSRQRLLRILLILGTIALTIVIIERLWAFGETLQGVLSTVAGAWLLAFAVRPYIDALHRASLPPVVLRWVERQRGAAWARYVGRWRIPYGIAVTLVYIMVVVVVVGLVTISVAAIIPQATDLIIRLPEIAARVPYLIVDAWASIAQRFGFDANSITSVVSTQEITSRLTQLAGTLAQQALILIAGAATVIGQFTLMLILSLYIVTEGRLIERQAFALIPGAMHEFIHVLIDAVNRAFDGYLRGYIVSGFLRGIFTAAVLSIFGVNFAVVLALIYGLLSLIPLVGSPIALVIIAGVTAMGHPEAVLPVTLIVFVFDQIVAYVIVPRIMSDTVGVPGLIGLLSITVGVQLFGFWGLIFGVPAMGAIYTVLFEYYLPRRRRAEGLPEYDPALEDIMPFKRARPPKPPEAPASPAANEAATTPAGTPPTVS